MASSVLGSGGLGDLVLGDVGTGEYDGTILAVAEDSISLSQDVVVNAVYQRTATAAFSPDNGAEPTFRTQVGAETTDLLLVPLAVASFTTIVSAMSGAVDGFAPGSTAVATFRPRVDAASDIDIPGDTAVATFRTQVSGVSAFTLDATAECIFQSRNRGVSDLSLAPEATAVFRTINSALDPLFILTDAVCVFHSRFLESHSITPQVLASAQLVSKFVQSTPHSLTLTVEARVYRLYNVEGESTLSLDDEAERGVFRRSVAHNLAISDSAGVFLLPSGKATSTLSDLSVSGSCQLKTVRAFNNITLEDSVIVVGPIYVTATTPIQTTTTVFNPATLTFSSTITAGLADLATATGNSVRHATSIVSFEDTRAGLVHVRIDGASVEAENSLEIGHEGRISEQADATNTLALADEAIAQTGTSASDLLTISSTAAARISNFDGAESILAIHQAARFTIERTCNRNDFAPAIGASSDPNAPEPPPASLPEASGDTGFKLIYPATGLATDTLEIPRSPELGNIDRFQMDRINRETRGGTLLVYADPIWPKITTLVLRFSSLNPDVAYALMTFMEDHIGEEIKVIDWEDRAWKGVITNPQDPVTEDSPGSFTASFELEGERQP